MLSCLALACALPAALAAVSVANTGPLRLLYQNDLSDSSTSAILVQSNTTYANAANACTQLNEQLLPSVTEDLQLQLRYLAYSGTLRNSTNLWVGGSSSQRRALRFERQSNCNAYNVGLQLVAQVSCDSNLQTLCTQSAAPSNAGTINGTVADTAQITVQANNYTVTGFRDARSFRFFGIPFAAPPVGDLRFASAQPYTGSTAVNATNFGGICLQATSGSAFAGGSASALNEDCLTLNVYTPTLPANGTSKGLAVAFWIYGGAYQTGAGSQAIYDGALLASRGDIVVVTFNYRLGLLGHVATQSLLDGSQSTTDQIMALKWVHANIAAFGGDPSRITMFGESAGAQSVLSILQSPAANGLYSAAISQSAPISPFFNRNYYVNGIVPALANATNCTTSSESALVSCLRSVDAQAFISTNVEGAVTEASVSAGMAFDGATLATTAVEPILPIVNGPSGMLTNQIAYQVGNGTLPGAGVPLMIGNMRDEAVLFVDLAQQPIANPSQEIVAGAVGIALNNRSATAVLSNPSLFALNNSDSDGLRDLLGNLITLNTWQCPLQQLMDSAASRSTFSALYSYRFDRGFFPAFPGSGIPDACTGTSSNGQTKVCHASDILPVFGTSATVGVGFNNDTNTASYTAYIQDVWTSFVRTHNPNPAPAYLRARGYDTTLAIVQSAPTFPQYTNNASIYHFNTQPSVTSKVYQPQCAALSGAGFLYNTVPKRIHGTVGLL